MRACFAEAALAEAIVRITAGLAPPPTRVVMFETQRGLDLLVNVTPIGDTWPEVMSAAAVRCGRPQQPENPWPPILLP